MVRVGFYQFCPAFGEVQRNLNGVLDALQEVEADLIALPELASLAEDPARSTTVDALAPACARYKRVGLAQAPLRLGRC